MNTPKDNLRHRCWTLTQQLVSLDTSEEGSGLGACVEMVVGILKAAGFETERIETIDSPAMVVARREARGGGAGRALLYNHYDVDEPSAEWQSEPFDLTVKQGRWYGLGVGDNKGALGARLAALPLLDTYSPELAWVIQGQEESGSKLARRWFQESCVGRFDLWLEENGWTDADGTQRILAAVGCPQQPHSMPSEGQSALILSGLGQDSSRRIEGRLMNKSLVPGGCPFQEAMPAESLYVAIGTNDALTRIHAPNESIADTAAERHALDFAALLGTVARGELP